MTHSVSQTAEKNKHIIESNLQMCKDVTVRSVTKMVDLKGWKGDCEVVSPFLV